MSQTPWSLYCHQAEEDSGADQWVEGDEGQLWADGG